MTVSQVSKSQNEVGRSGDGIYNCIQEATWMVYMKFKAGRFYIKVRTVVQKQQQRGRRALFYFQAGFIRSMRRKQSLFEKARGETVTPGVNQL